MRAFFVSTRIGLDAPSTNRLPKSRTALAREQPVEMLRGLVAARERRHSRHRRASDGVSIFTRVVLATLHSIPAGAVFLRPEMDDAKFLREHAMATGIAGLIVRPRQLHVLESDTAERKQRVDEVKELLAKPGTISIFDPETAALCGIGVDTEDGAERLRETPVARCTTIPWTAELLIDPDRQQHVLEVTWAEGAFADALTAPYVRIARGDDEALELNVEFVRRTAAAARAEGKPMCAVIEANIGAITSGWLTGIAHPLRDAGADIVLLRVVAFREDAGLRHLRACLELVRELRREGLDVICDQVGRVGPVLVAATGCAFSTGSWHFRSVARQLVPKKAGGGGSRAIPYELNADWRDAPVSLARSLDRARCPIEGCRALEVDATPADLRAHFLHTMVRSAGIAAQADGLDRTITSLNAAKGKLSGIWAAALTDVQSDTG